MGINRRVNVNDLILSKNDFVRTDKEVDTFFGHYGIKGQKWGIIRKNPGGGNKNASETASTLSNTELKKRVQRLNMEKQYVELTNQKSERDRSVLQKGLQETNNMVAKASKRALQGFADAAASNLLEVALGVTEEAIDKANKAR